jgi:hypothetical protein
MRRYSLQMHNKITVLSVDSKLKCCLNKVKNYNILQKTKLQIKLLKHISGKIQLSTICKGKLNSDKVWKEEAMGQKTKMGNVRITINKISFISEMVFKLWKAGTEN